MRIALTHPYCWPHVQRGGERLFADLARYLTGAGHEVTTVSAGGDRTERTVDGRHAAVRFRGFEPPWLRDRDVDQAVTYLPRAAWELRRRPLDVVHGMFHLDGVAARWSGAPYVLSVQGMPLRRNLDRRRVHRLLFPLSVGPASAVLAVSAAAATAFEREFGRRAEVVHNGVFVDDFVDASGGTSRTERPTVLFPADPGDPRKRLDVLVRAMEGLRSRRPGLVLRVAASVGREVRARLDSADVDVELLDVRSPAGMPEAYATSWVTCLPAVREAFGLVLVESLASGTPVVGVRDGGVPEVLDEPRWLAEPDDPASLAAALDRALGDVPEARERCLAAAGRFDWSVRGPRFEEIYERIRA